jgi:hypothetical protein
MQSKGNKGSKGNIISDKAAREGATLKIIVTRLHVALWSTEVIF